MKKRDYLSAGAFAVVLMVASATVRVSTASAGGYMTSSGIDGEVVCEPGGSNDCPTNG